MGISRQAYYKRNRAYDARAAENRQVLAFVLEKRRRQPRWAPASCILLGFEAQMPFPVGRDRLLGILREARQLVPRKRAYHKTTHSHHRFRRHPNLLKDGPLQIVAKGPEQVWVADITYLPTRESVAYLSLITDAFSRKIVGHHVHVSLHTESVIRARKNAVGERKTKQPLVHHQIAECRANSTGRRNTFDRGVYGTTRSVDAKFDGTSSDALTRCAVTSQ